MIIAYASMTGNVKRFVGKLNEYLHGECEIKRIDSELVINEPYILITYTTGKGETPKEVVSFLSNDINASNIKGVIGSGNRNWGSNFCKGAVRVSERFNIPLLHNFEISGYDSDVRKVAMIVNEGMVQ